MDSSFPWRVYAAHTLATWGDNMWWFAGGLYMMQIDTKSLQLTAIYGLVLAATVILFGASVGNWIDKTRRIVAARTFLVIQNLCVSICALTLSFYLFNNNVNSTVVSSSNYDVIIKWLVIVTSILVSAVAKLASSGTVILIQKDWIVVIANGDNDKLAGMNSVLRTIELTTYMLAPILAGQLFTFAGYVWTGFFIAGWNVVSVIFEYILLAGIYKQYPKLDKKAVVVQEEQLMETLPLNNEVIDKNGNKEPVLKPVLKPVQAAAVTPPSYISETLSGWKLYYGHEVRNAGIGLALLYMTVLGFDNITYGYVIMQGIPEAILGGVVAISALIGVIGSATYPILRKWLGLEKTGCLGMFLLVSMSSLSVASVFVPTSPFWNNFEGQSFDDLKTSGYTSVIVLLTGITAARYGLWIVDLSITQILQERVEESRRGVINGVQDSMNNTLDLLKCVLVICMPRQESFGILIFLSFASISTGWIFYSVYFCKRVRKLKRQQQGPFVEDGGSTCSSSAVEEEKENLTHTEEEGFGGSTPTPPPPPALAIEGPV